MQQADFNLFLHDLDLGDLDLSPKVVGLADSCLELSVVLVSGVLVGLALDKVCLVFVLSLNEIIKELAFLLVTVLADLFNFSILVDRHLVVEASCAGLV